MIAPLSGSWKLIFFPILLHLKIILHLLVCLIRKLKIVYCLKDSSAKDDIVVNEPQNPIATRSEYFGSRFQIRETIEKTPRTKLPSTLIARTINGKAPNQKGVDTILYLRNVPAKVPTANNTNSIPFIFLYTYQIFPRSW
jgi:hypothetical protein